MFRRKWIHLHVLHGHDFLENLNPLRFELFPTNHVYNCIWHPDIEAEYVDEIQFGGI